MQKKWTKFEKRCAADIPHTWRIGAPSHSCPINADNHSFAVSGPCLWIIPTPKYQFFSRFKAFKCKKWTKFENRWAASTPHMQRIVQHIGDKITPFCSPSGSTPYPLRLHSGLRILPQKNIFSKRNYFPAGLQILEFLPRAAISYISIIRLNFYFLRESDRQRDREPQHFQDRAKLRSQNDNISTVPRFTTWF